MKRHVKVFSQFISESRLLEDALAVDPLKSTIDNYIDRTIAEIKVDLPKPKIEIVSADSIITEVSLYLKSIVPTTIAAMKKGDGGVDFVFDTIAKIETIINKKISDIGGFKRVAIRTGALVFAPSREDFITMANSSSDFDVIFQKVKTLLDWGFAVGYLDARSGITRQDSANIAKFSKQAMDYLKKRRPGLKAAIIERVADFIYGKKTS